MKAFQYQGNNKFSVVRKDIRRLVDGEALVKVEACGVCGTDLHIVDGVSRSVPPIILGHEFHGIVTELSDKLSTFQSGDRVAIDPNIYCGTCYYCRRGLVHLCSSLQALGVDIDGGMAEYCIVPVSQLYKLPESFPTEFGVLIEPVSCAIHGIDRAGIRQGDTVVILGGGAVGLLMLLLARRAGASRIILSEPVEFKRETAHAMGADIVLDPTKQDVRDAVIQETGVGADIVVECVGKPETMQLSLQLARRGGAVLLFGVCPVAQKISIEPHHIFVNELTIMGSYINPHTFDRAIAVIASGIVPSDVFPTKAFSLEEVPDALTSLRRGESLKNIIYPFI
jgi:2-desacetyl-2-hydroxyethyl bacteriochlorophyllide A dehydrogenase